MLATPKASTNISIKILHSMIVPVTSYAAVANCLKSDTMFAEQDTEIRKAARLAIHAPFNVRNDYVEKEAHLTNSKIRAIEHAKRYLMSNDRSQSVKRYMNDFRQRNTRPWKTPTPLTIVTN